MADFVRTVVHWIIDANPDNRPFRPLHLSIP